MFQINKQRSVALARAVFKTNMMGKRLRKRETQWRGEVTKDKTSQKRRLVLLSLFQKKKKKKKGKKERRISYYCINIYIYKFSVYICNTVRERERERERESEREEPSLLGGTLQQGPSLSC